MKFGLHLSPDQVKEAVVNMVKKAMPNVETGNVDFTFSYSHDDTEFTGATVEITIQE